MLTVARPYAASKYDSAGTDELAFALYIPSFCIASAVMLTLLVTATRADDLLLASSGALRLGWIVWAASGCTKSMRADDVDTLSHDPADSYSALLPS